MTDTVVLLPGLDGTGLLLRDFIRALQQSVRVRTVCYPTQTPLDYDGLMPLVRDQLPLDDYIIIGESFSGPLALRLAQENPERLKGIVLGASFARLDLPLKSLLRFLSTVIPPGRVPTGLLVPLLLGGSSTPELRKDSKEALAAVAPEVLRVRARAAMNVDLLTSGGNIQKPVLYLRAASDRLVPKSAAHRLFEITSDLRIQDVAAPHFLFQVAPDECASAVHQFRQDVYESNQRNEN